MGQLERLQLGLEDIREFRDPATLYIADFRAISDSLTEDSHWVRYYENMLLPLVEAGFAIHNEAALVQFTKNPQVEYVTVPSSRVVQQSLASRLQAGSNWPGVRRIWAAVPHPELDALATENQFQLNYSHLDFRQFNDKITQKQTVPAALTPGWRIEESLLEASAGCFLKRRFGCGGLEVWAPEHTHNLDGREYRVLVQEDPHNWYEEQAITGKAYSAALYTLGNETVLFGWSEQLFSEKAVTSCLGGKLYAADTMPDEVHAALAACVEALRERLLASYQGFWGIDFMLEQGTDQFYFLEANVRFTTLTGPHLLREKAHKKTALFQEGVETFQFGDLITNFDPETTNYDVLSGLSV